MSGPNFSDPASSGVPGFNELYYLSNYSDAKNAVANGSYESGLAYYQAIGKNRDDFTLMLVQRSVAQIQMMKSKRLILVFLQSMQERE